MSNTNSGSFNAQNSSVVALIAGGIFEGQYSSCLDFSTISVSLNCDSNYHLDVYYSHDGFNDDYIENIVGVTPSSTQFYVLEPKMRYFKIKLTNTSVNAQTYLTLQTILKSSFVYATLNVDISGQVVDISGQVVDISGQSVSISNSVLKVDQIHASNSNYGWYPAGSTYSLSISSVPSNLTNIIIATDDNGLVSNYIKFYDTSGVPNLGVDEPVLVSLANGYVFGNTINQKFNNGIGVCICGGIQDTSTANTLSTVLLTILYDII